MYLKIYLYTFLKKYIIYQFGKHVHDNLCSNGSKKKIEPQAHEFS